MIGFEMTARDNRGFYWHRRPWTEGSLAFVNLALSAESNFGPGGKIVSATLTKARGQQVNAIKSLFSQFKAMMLYDAAYVGFDAYMVVWGDVNFTYDFHANASPDQAALELLWKVEQAGMGEQVVINLCRCILDWQLEVVSNNWTDRSRYAADLGLYVKIDL